MRRIVQWLAYLLVIKTIITTIQLYPRYFRPDFQSAFLFGRESYFHGMYQWAFYVHILAGPLSLFLGMLLMNTSFQRKSPRWHRRIGKTQIACILLFVVPSGLWMSQKAPGFLAQSGFATLAGATAICVVLGWIAAVRRHFQQHRIWMLRCFALLCSAVVIRLIGGLAKMAAWEGTYPMAAWLSWVVPLFVLEIYLLRVSLIPLPLSEKPPANSLISHPTGSR